MKEEREPGALLSEEKRRELIASCPVRKAGKKHKKFCLTCPLKPWCKNG